ncbi:MULTISPECIES: hypothetical protein [unclassified Pseudoalteromonas]|uniref:hypothetical protein n=1 Tax=Pseudoalteromonas TaxID=53246 RepID=UPI0020172FE3|nr:MULTISPECIES: hypothetical protein [unclassified Pseudoalteromonas]MCK8097400.1 hypothetical protein [Pseudoalteromonas sp. 1CM17D]
MFETLYLHIGWSKTGTSAVQFQLDLQKETLKQQGILYSTQLQMNDQAHHHFALAFAPIHGYPAKYKIPEVLDLLEQEILDNECHSALISSELSPFYFNNPRFQQWAKKFKKVVVIGTVRRQSDLLLSLFNQLVKDPQVRYQGRFFQMALNNFPRLNYFQQLNRWAQSVGKENVWVINYDDGVVETFLRLFGLMLENTNDNVVINASLPTSALLLLQERTQHVSDVVKYTSIRDNLIEEINAYPKTHLPKRILLTKGELQALNSYFLDSNNLCADFFTDSNELFKSKVCKDVLCY